MMYSRTITCDQNVNVRQSGKPFINLKIEIMNNCPKKRKLEESSPDACFETPAKKAFGTKALSPDLGYSSPPDGQNCMSPVSSSRPALQTQATEAVNLHLQWQPAFDGDVESILCLNPSVTGSADSGENPKNPSGSVSKKTPLILNDLQEGKAGDGKLEKGEQLKKDAHLNLKEVEEDKGYFSMSYMKDIKSGKDVSQSVSPLVPPATSSPLPRVGEVERITESSSDRSCDKQAVLSGSDISLHDLDPILSGPLVVSVSCPVEQLEDNTEVWNIGLPIFESSVCHNVTVKLNAGSERSWVVSEEGQGGAVEPFHGCQTTPDGEETALGTSYESTLPLQVQVKSVVVAINQQPSSSTPAALPPPKLDVAAAKTNPKDNRVSQTSTARSHRPVTVHTEVDLERDKRLYLHSVTSHLKENPGAAQDAMMELQNMMSHVADQTTGSNDIPWQHPSDLTRRNYQRQFRNTTPAMGLDEWQAKNNIRHKRFAKVPKIFQRTPYP